LFASASDMEIRGLAAVLVVEPTGERRSSSPKFLTGPAQLRSSLKSDSFMLAPCYGSTVVYGT
jgi:hypothetical protein